MLQAVSVHGTVVKNTHILQLLFRIILSYVISISLGSKTFEHKQEGSDIFVRTVY